MPTDIRQLTKAGEQFYPQTHLAALVGYGENGRAIDDEPTAGSDNLVKSGGVCSVMEEHVGIPSRATMDFTSGATSRNIYYKVSKGWKLSGSVENKSTLSSIIYIKAYDANDTQISAVTLNGVAQDEIRTFTFYSETDDIEYINITIGTRVVLDVVVSAEKSEQLRNELRNIYKDIDKRTVMFTPVNSGVYTLAYDNLAIKSGDSFKLFINANASWTRLIVSSDKNGTNRLYDVSDTASSFARVLTANVNIDKLYICVIYTGTITLSSEILTNVAYSLSSTVEQQQTDIGQLTSAVTKSTSDIADINADLYKEVDEVSWDSNSDLLKDINLSTLIGVKVRITISNTGSTNDTTVTLKAKSNVSGVIDIILDHIVINKGDSYTVDYTPSTFNVVTYQVQCNAGRTTCTILFEELTITKLADSITKQGTRIATIESNIIPTDYIENCTIDKNGALHVSQSNYKVSPFLGLDGSDIVLEKAAYINLGGTNIAIPCVFYDRDKNKLFFDSYYEPSDEGVQDITIQSSSIPETAAYIRCTLQKANGKVISGVCNNIEDLQDIADSGFSLGNCRDYIIKDLAYRPLGEFTKGYIAFSADDGTLGAYTYTLPMVKQKDIPFTFFIASNSIIMRGQTQEERDIKDVFVQEFTAENTKIFAGQHALFNWTLLKEDELYNFFMKEKAFFDNLGIKIRGAVPPTGMTNPMINAMAGGLYDVVRCYWAVRDENNQIRTNENYYAVWEYFGAISSPRDNMFCLTSANIRDADLNKWKGVIDYAAEHKRLVNIYIHDFDFIETATDYLARRELLEAVIDYAKSKQGIEIIPFEKIPRLTASLPHTNVWGN